MIAPFRRGIHIFFLSESFAKRTDGDLSEKRTNTFPHRAVGRARSSDKLSGHRARALNRAFIVLKLLHYREKGALLDNRTHTSVMKKEYKSTHLARKPRVVCIYIFRDAFTYKFAENHSVGSFCVCDFTLSASLIDWTRFSCIGRRFCAPLDFL